MRAKIQNMKNIRNYTPEFKTKVVLELLKGIAFNELSEKYNITYPTLRNWKEVVVNNMSSLLGRKTENNIQLKKAKVENKKMINQIEKMTLELDFLKSKRCSIILIRKLEKK
jgi:transposase-like protein